MEIGTTRCCKNGIDGRPIVVFKVKHQACKNVFDGFCKEKAKSVSKGL